jgi:transglutaminase-like putative cysteine protease
MNIPARYVTGYIGDIRVPSTGAGDFSAWYQVWLDGKWWDMDARHNYARYGRILMATGRDAADVAITTSFGRSDLTNFYVESYEIDSEGKPVPLPEKLPTTPVRTPLT